MVTKQGIIVIIIEIIIITIMITNTTTVTTTIFINAFHCYLHCLHCRLCKTIALSSTFNAVFRVLHYADLALYVLYLMLHDI